MKDKDIQAEELRCLIEEAKKQEWERIEALAFKDTNYGIWGQKMLLSDGWRALKEEK